MANFLRLVGLFFLLNVGMMACSSLRDREPAEVPMIVVDLEKQDDSTAFWSHFQYARYVILETTDQSLIQGINKVIRTSDRIYIMDRQQRCILIFDQDGRFVSRFNRAGRAGNEYLYLTDFRIEDNGAITVYDGLSGILRSYTLDGTLLSRKEIGKGLAIEPVGADLHAVYSGFGRGDGSAAGMSYQVYQGDKIIAEQLPCTDKLAGRVMSYGQGSSTFYRFGADLFLTAMYNDTIYKIDPENGLAKPYFAFDPGVSRVQPDWTQNQINEFLAQRYPSGPVSLYRFGDDGLLVTYYTTKAWTRLIVRMGDTPQVLYQGYPGFGVPRFSMRIAPYEDQIHSGQLLSVESPDFIIASVEGGYADGDTVLHEIASKINDQSNPVLVFYNWVD